MSPSPQPVDFSAVLASAVHDMKNSLSLVLQSIENLSRNIASENPNAAGELASIHYEASRLNTGLVQILSLYRAGVEQLPVSIDEHFIDDVLDEVLASNENYINNKNMEVDIKAEEDLGWYLDGDLVVTLLNDIFVNAMRYSKKRLCITATKNDDWLEIKIEDDGPGYPDAMLVATTSQMSDFDIRQGRTGLGLYFARMIAAAHKDGEREGSIQLENGGIFGGSVFTLKLP